MATIETVQRKNGSSYKVWWSNRDGTRDAKTFRLRREAETHKRQIEQELAAGTHRPDGQRMTVDELAARYLEDVEAKWQRGQLARGTRENIAAKVRLYIRPDKIGHMRLRDVTTADVDHFHDRLWDIKPPLAGGTVAGVRSILHKMLEYGRKELLLAVNPATGVKLVIPEGREQAPIQIPTDDQIKLLLVAAQTPPPERKGGPPSDPVRLYTMLLLTVVTGVRDSELRGMTWGDIGWNEQVVRVRQQLARWHETKRPKTKAGVREIPVVDAELWRALRLWRLRSKYREAADFVFANDAGAGFSRSAVNEPWQKLQAAVGIKGMHWHALRHYCISNWLLANIPLITVAGWAGHANPTVTLGTYGHLIKRDTSKTVLERLAEERATFMQQNR